MNKVLVKLYVPVIELEYDIWLPINKKIYKIIDMLVKAVDDLSEGYYKPSKRPMLYNKLTGRQYDLNLNVKENNIVNTTEIILI